MIKTKMTVKKPFGVKQPIQTGSTLKPNTFKKELQPSAQSSTKEEIKIKIKHSADRNQPSTDSQQQKPSFLKMKGEKTEEYLKKKDELDKIILHKYTAKDKLRSDKKVDGRQSFNEKYHDYFDFKNNARQANKKINPKLSDSGDSANSLNSIQSEGSKRIIVKKYQANHKIIQSHKAKSQAYSIKNSENSLGAPTEPKDFARNHGRMRSTLNQEQPANKVKVSQMKSLSPKVKVSYESKNSQNKLNSIKSTDSLNKDKFQMKKIPKDTFMLGKNQNDRKQQSAGSINSMQTNSKNKIEAQKAKIGGTLNKKKGMNSPLVHKNVKYEKKDGGQNQIGKKASGSGSISQKSFKTGQKLKKVDKKGKKVRLWPLASNQEVQLIFLKKLAQHDDESVVYVCLHEQSQTVYCLKSCLVKGERIGQLIRQIKIGSELNHPNLVKTYSTFHDEEYLHLLMQYMNDRTLFHVLQEKTFRYQRIDTTTTVSKCPLTHHLSKVNRIRQILKQVLKGLAYLHEKGVVHRDLKPQNIFISHDTYKIGDFGSSSLKNEQEYIGTLDYASPEIITKKSYDKSIDMWSIGCIAYELDVGRPPFFHIDRKQTMRRITNIQYESSIVSDPDLKDMIEKLLLIPGSLRLSAEQTIDHPFLNQLLQSRNRS